jgi:D-alanyl-D-alanine carboxypeptidase/D-alanyl-D-alanine-endopeptidase (penicillin-binding protein 4)
LLLGTGDPNISGRMHRGDVTRPLRELGHGLARAGITRITGALLYDGRAFDGPRIHPDWPDDQFLKWYSAEVSALTLNDNCLTLAVEPGAPGKAARVSLSPATGFVSTTGSVATNGKKADPKVGFGRMPGSNDVRLWGELSAHRGTYVGEITVTDPDAYCAHVLLETLAANGIAVDGGAKPAGAESDSRVWREIGRYESDLGTVAAVCNQRSQNLYAENLFRVLARSQGKPASFAGGASAVEQWLKAKRIPSSGLVVADGSGLARTNRVSAETLARVLALMDKGKEASVYRSTFAVSGESGTLDKRLGDDRTRGRVYAKTGTIRGVSSLSGYAVSLSGKRYAFSVIVNNYSGSARSAIDRFVIELVTGG